MEKGTRFCTRLIKMPILDSCSFLIMEKDRNLWNQQDLEKDIMEIANMEIDVNSSISEMIET